MQLQYKIEDNLVITGNTVTSKEKISLDKLSKEFVLNGLAEHGMLLLRGFESDKEQYSNLIQRCSLRVTVDPARKFISKNAQLVDAGLGAIGLHCENGNAPKLPHLIWFFCERAASIGSYTTYCDGYNVIDRLSNSIKEQFKNKRIKYTRTLKKQIWQKYVFHEVGGFNDYEEVEFNDLIQLETDKNNKQVFTLQDDGSVYSEFSCWAIHDTYFNKKKAFANSLLGPSVNYEPPIITFEDGSKISDETWAEISSVTESCTNEIKWQNGDVVVIDNTRFMHGRREILDKNRVIFAGLSYLN